MIARRVRSGWRAPAALAVAAACAGDGTTPIVEPPHDALRAEALAAGLAPVAGPPPRPAENPYSQPRVELGHLLFFDPILSGPLDVACSTCHLPRFGLADGRQFPSGAGASGLGPERTDPAPAPLRLMPRNSPTIVNLGLYGRNGTTPSTNGMIFWSGGAFGIEDQTLLPIVADNELRGLAYPKAVALDSVVARLRATPEYVERFAAAFPELVPAGAPPAGVVTSLTLRRTLAAYLRELVTPNAPIDDFLRGDDTALSDAQRRGLALFIGKGGCVACHTGPLFSDFRHHVIGAKQYGIGRDTTPGDDLGFGEFGGIPYAFRTAPLRQVSLTSPYLHAGTAETLAEVVAFKNRGVSDNLRVPDSALDPAVRPLGLTAAEVADLVAFLGALTDDRTTREPLFNAPARVPSGLTIPQ